MAKVQIKSEKLTPFRGFFSIMSKRLRVYTLPFIVKVLTFAP